MTSRRILAFAAGLVALSSWTAGAPSQKAEGNSLPDVTLDIQTKKLTYLVDERFLSMSVDPEQLIRHSQPGPGALRLLSMVTAMSPAYLRVAGPSTDLMGFEGGPSHVGESLTVNDEHWSHFQNLCRTAGLRAIIALSSRRRPGAGTRWDSRDAMRILGAVDASSEAPAGWQLGYDWTTLRKEGITSGQAAKDIHTLKSLIEEFPTLAKEAQILLGPDVDATNPDADAAADLTKGANVGAVVIRPFTIDDPTGAKLDKDFINKVLGRNAKRPLWFAESGGACTAPFSSALLWAQRLCTANRLGAQVILRELDLDAARENATPDFWVSLLHKTLTSRGTLDARRSGQQAGDLSVSAHCTPSTKDESPKTSPISIRYDLGAVTVMAANPSNRALRLSLDIARGSGIGSLASPPNDIGTLVHEYILTAPNDDLNATSTLLNGSPLELAHGGSIPVLSPRLLKLQSPFVVTLPAKSVAFWVVPGAKARACLTPPASSDVAPAASRLQPISARGMEIGVHLDDHSPLHTEYENEEPEHRDDLSEESDEGPLAKDLRRRRQKLSARPSGVSRLPLPRTSTLPRRSNFDINLGRTTKEPEAKTLDDFIREELRRRPTRARASEPLKLPILPSLTPSLPGLSAPSPPYDFPVVQLPPMPNIPSLSQIDSTMILDPLKLNSDLQKISTNLQQNLAQHATTPIRNLVKITDGLLDQIQSSPQGGRKKRSADDDSINLGFFDEDTETVRFDMDDDPIRSKRQTVIDYMKEDLKRKHKKAPSEHDVKRPRDEEHPRRRRFAPEDIGLRFKRKPAIPDFVSLPRLPKKPLLSSAAAKRAQQMISQSNDEGVSFHNSWGSPHREMFPHGDVYAGTEDLSDKKDPNVDYVSDDDYPEPVVDSGTSLSKSNKPTPQRDVMYYAPGEFYEAYANQGRSSIRNPKSMAGEFGELEHLPGQTSPPVANQRRTSARVPSRGKEFVEKGHFPGTIAQSFDDSEADNLKVVPAAKPNKEKEAEIQSELRKRLDEHYRDVQRAALDQKAEDGSNEDDVPEENIDMDSIKALAERYRQEKKLNLPEDGLGSANGLQKKAEPKEAEKVSHEKSRRRRDVGALKSAESGHGKHDESIEVVNSKVPPQRKGLPIIKKAETDSSHTAHEMREKRLEKIKAFKEKMKTSDHPHIPLNGKLGHDSQEHNFNRHKRGAGFDDPFPSEQDFHEIVRQIDREGGTDIYPQHLSEATQRSSDNPEPKQEELLPFAQRVSSQPSLDTSNRRSFGVEDFGSPYSAGHGIYSQLPFRPEYSTHTSNYRPGSGYHRPGSSYHRPGFGSYPSHSSESIPSHFGGSSDESCSSSVETSSEHNQNYGYAPRNVWDFEPNLDFLGDVDAEDFSLERRGAEYEQPQPQRLPNVVAVPWEISFPSSVRFRRSVDSAGPNTIVQTDAKQKSQAEIAEAIRQLHRILNEDSLSSEETSVEVNHERRLIESPETVDSLEDTIQTLLNMTKSLNQTLNQGDEMLSWSDFGMDDTRPSDPHLDAEEMKFRDAAVAWIQAAKTGVIQMAPQENGESASSPHHGSVKKDLPDGEESSAAAKELARQRKLTEQENIVSSMMQQVSALLSQLRNILNKKEVDSDKA